MVSNRGSYIVLDFIFVDYFVCVVVNFTLLFPDLGNRKTRFWQQTLAHNSGHLFRGSKVGYVFISPDNNRVRLRKMQIFPKRNKIKYWLDRNETKLMQTILIYETK